MSTDEQPKDQPYRQFFEEVFAIAKAKHDLKPCHGCGISRCSSPITADEKTAFKRMTGYGCYSIATVSYDIRKDRETLGLSLGVGFDAVPEQVDLCIPCAVAYTKRFNELLKLKRLQSMGS